MHGCSLKIHRVESALLTIKAAPGKLHIRKGLVQTVPLATILIASKRIFNGVERHLEIQVMTNRSLTEMSKNHSHYGITRQVKDLTDSP